MGGGRHRRRLGRRSYPRGQLPPSRRPVIGGVATFSLQGGVAPTANTLASIERVATSSDLLADGTGGACCDWADTCETNDVRERLGRRRHGPRR